MQLTIFLVEIVLIFAWLEWDKVDKHLKTTPIKKEIYSSYTTLNSDILLLNNLPKPQQVELFKRSSTMQKVQDSFPNFSEMVSYINQNIEDGDFKNELLDYIDYWQNEYVAGEISYDELGTKIFFPTRLEID
jgi:hypothetical protein